MQYELHGGKNQQFKLVETTTHGIFAIYSVNSGLYIDINGGNINKKGTDII